MTPSRIADIALLVVGVALFVVGMNAKDPFADQWSKFFTGHFADTTVWHLIGGVAAAVVGVVLHISGRRHLTIQSARADEALDVYPTVFREPGQKSDPIEK